MTEQLLGNDTGTVTDDRQSAEDEFYLALTGALGAQAQRIAMQQVGFTQTTDREFWDNEKKIIASLLLVWLLKIGEQAIGGTVSRVMTPAGLGVSEAVNAKAAAWAEKHALELAANLTTTTREIAKRQITAWLTEGGRDIGKLTQILGDTIGPAWRAEMIAQTETTAAYSNALQLIAGEYDEITGFQWQSQNDERVCPVCGYLHGEQRKKGGVYLGVYSAPPAHPRCRCEELLIVLMPE